MPLHLLQQQLGHKNIEMTMHYARFHPKYSDVGDYLENVGRSFGLAQERDDWEAAVVEAARALSLEPEELARALEQIRPQPAI